MAAEAVAWTSAPSARASWTAARPTPPEAAWMRTALPGPEPGEVEGGGGGAEGDRDGGGGGGAQAVGPAADQGRLCDGSAGHRARGQAEHAVADPEVVDARPDRE